MVRLPWETFGALGAVMSYLYGDPVTTMSDFHCCKAAGPISSQVWGSFDSWSLVDRDSGTSPSRTS